MSRRWPGLAILRSTTSLGTRISEFLTLDFNFWSLSVLEHYRILVPLSRLDGRGLEPRIGSVHTANRLGEDCRIVPAGNAGADRRGPRWSRWAMAARCAAAGGQLPTASQC